jgi:hypothetical protein
MLPIKFFIVLIVVAVIGTIFILLSGDLIPQSTATSSNSPVSAGDDPADPATVDTGELISSTAEPVESPVLLQKEGPSLLEFHCTQCHMTQALKKFKKSRSEWEMTLTQMEEFSGHLDDTEKIILLDYLAPADNP